MKITRIFFLFFSIVFVSCASAADKKGETESSQTQEVSEAERYYSFAFEYMKQKNYKEAASLLEKSIKADSTYADAYLMLRQVYLIVGDTNKALTLCKKGFRCFSDPESSRKMAKAIASLYAKTGETEKAEKIFTDIIKEYPKDGNSYDLYAYFLESEGRYDEALDNYKKAYQLNPDDGGVAFRLGNAYFERGRYQEAVDFLGKAKEVFSDDIEIRKKLAESYSELEQYSKAIEEYKSIIKIIPKHVSSRIQIGNVYLKMKQYQKAESYYKEALKLEPGNLSVYYQLINLELTRKNLSGVKAYINKGFSIDPNDYILLALQGDYYYRLGLNYMQEKKWNPSIESFEEAIRVWRKTMSKTSDPKWIEFAQKGIRNAQKGIEEAKKVRW
ncbi:tetratricopeptide repeat protein [candidate division WOR-3 bacterium]|nr:tetratricopeptide repeat protein [candidate division WOR-3 bacterium]